MTRPATLQECSGRAARYRKGCRRFWRTLYAGLAACWLMLALAMIFEGLWRI